MRRSGFTDGGEPSSASYGTLVFGRDQTVDDAKTEFVPAGDEKNEAKELAAPPPRQRAAEHHAAAHRLAPAEDR